MAEKDLSLQCSGGAGWYDQTKTSPNTRLALGSDENRRS